MIHQDCYNKYYTINFYEDHIEIEINYQKIILIKLKYILSSGFLSN